MTEQFGEMTEAEHAEWLAGLASGDDEYPHTNPYAAPWYRAYQEELGPRD